MSVLDTQTVRRTTNRRQRRKASASARLERTSQRRVDPPLARSRPSDSFRATSPAGRWSDWIEVGLETAIDGGRRILRSTGWLGAVLTAIGGRSFSALSWLGIFIASVIWRGITITADLLRRSLVFLTPRVSHGVRRSAVLGRQGAVTSARVGKRVAVRTRVELRNQAEDMRDGFPDLAEGLASSKKLWRRLRLLTEIPLSEARRKGLLARPTWRQSLRAAANGLMAGGTGIAAAAAAVFGPPAVRQSDTLALAEFDVRGNEVVGTEDLVAATRVELGDNLTTIALDEVAVELAKLPWIESARLRRVYPDRLAIIVEEREPALLLADHQLWFVDRYGEVFKPVEPGEWTDLPVVTGVTVDERGVDPEGCRERLQRAMTVVESIEATQTLSSAQVGELRMDSDSGVEVLLADGGVTLNLGNGDLEIGLNRLDTLIERDLIALDQVTRLDLGLRNQVVATWKAEL